MNTRSLRKLLAGLLSLTLLGAAAPAQAATVKLTGSVTLCTKVAAKKAELEAASGQTFDIVPNTTGKGIVDLVEGRCDIALVGGVWETILADINAKNPGKIDPASLTITQVKPTALVFVTDAANPVKGITVSQAAGILTGKIANWKDVGGADQPIALVLPPPTNGFRIHLQGTLLKGAPFAAGREIPDLRNIPLVISQLPGSVSFQSTDLAMAPGTKVIPLDQPLSFPLMTVTKKNPSPEAGKAVAAIVAAFK